MTELDRLTRLAMVERRFVEKESELSLLSWRGVPPMPASPSEEVWIRTLRGVCGTLPIILPGKLAGATGRSSACSASPPFVMANTKFDAFESQLDRRRICKKNKTSWFQHVTAHYIQLSA